MARPVEIGIFIAPVEGTLDGKTPRWTDIETMARIAEEIGMDSIWIPDMLRVSEDVGIWEGMALVSALAASTSHIRIGSSVICTLLRNPALLAKMVDTIDEISGGRIILGLGSGRPNPTFDVFGYPNTHLFSLFQEVLQIITGLLRDGQVDFDGTYYQARKCELRPRGPRPEGPPILIGARGPRMMKLTAQHADIWNWYTIYERNHPDTMMDSMADMDAACAEFDRDPLGLRRSVTVAVAPTDRTDTESVGLGDPIAGSPEEIAETLREYGRRGFSEIQIVHYPHTTAGVEAMAPVLEALDSP